MIEMCNFANVTEQVLRVKSSVNEELCKKVLNVLAENTAAFTDKLRAVVDLTYDKCIQEKFAEISSDSPKTIETRAINALKNVLDEEKREERREKARVKREQKKANLTNSTPEPSNPQ